MGRLLVRTAPAMRRMGWLCVLLLLCLVLVRPSSAAPDSAEAFMSVTFGLSSKRTQLRMEHSGAEASGFIRDGQLSMEGLFEGRPAVFVFGFHAKKGLNYKAVYLTSTGDGDEDRAFYDALRRAYTARFGNTKESPLPNTWAEGRLLLRNVWEPDRYTTVTLSYNPEATNRFPGNSPGARPIHLIYQYSRWDKK